MDKFEWYGQHTGPKQGKKIRIRKPETKEITEHFKECYYSADNIKKEEMKNLAYPAKFWKWLDENPHIFEAFLRFKISNDMIPGMARWAMALHPNLRGFFTLRQHGYDE